MEVITGYFISRDNALEAAEFLRNKGFQGEISVLGRHNNEDDPETDNRRSDSDDVVGVNSFGDMRGINRDLAGYSAVTASGSGPLVGAGFIGGMFGGNYGGELNRIISDWGVPPRIGEEIRNVIASGNAVMLVECEDNEKSFISNSLQSKGAQNIHV